MFLGENCQSPKTMQLLTMQLFAIVLCESENQTVNKSISIQICIIVPLVHFDASEKIYLFLRVALKNDNFARASNNVLYILEKQVIYPRPKTILQGIVNVEKYILLLRAVGGSPRARASFVVKQLIGCVIYR